MRRRTFSALMGILLLIPLVQAPVARAAFPRDDVVGGGAVQIAEADWMVNDRGELWWYFAAGIRYVSPPEVESYAAVGRGRCTKIKRRNMTIIACSASGRARPVTLDDFWIEPDMSSARLRVERAKDVSEVMWEAKERIEPFVYAEVTAHGGFAAGGAYRWAPASGTVLGKELKGRGGFRDFGIVAKYAGAGFFVPGRSLSIRPDGTFVARARFELPR